MSLVKGLTSWEEILGKCISDLKQRHPRLSDAQIADSIDIRRSTFNRIKNEGKFPRLDNLIKIVIGSGNSEILAEAIALLDEGLGKSLKSALSVALNEKNQILTSSELEQLFEDRTLFVAYLLADMPNGTSKEQVVEVLGNSGLHSIAKLIKKEILKEEFGRYFVVNRGVLIRSFDSIKHHLNTYSKFYKPEHVGQERNYAHSLTDGLNKAGLKKVQEAHRRLHEELQNIYRDEANKGNIPSFSVAFCDTFTAINSTSEEKGELQ